MYQQFSNLLISQRDMSGPRLDTLSNNRWSVGKLERKIVPEAAREPVPKVRRCRRVRWRGRVPQLPQTSQGEGPEPDSPTDDFFEVVPGQSDGSEGSDCRYFNVLQISNQEDDGDQRKVETRWNGAKRSKQDVLDASFIPLWRAVMSFFVFFSFLPIS